MANRLTKWLERLIFKKKEFIKESTVENIPVKNKRKIRDIKIFDDITIKINTWTSTYAWVIAINANTIHICYDDKYGDIQEIEFKIRGLYDESIIKDNNKLLILNKEDI